MSTAGPPQGAGAPGPGVLGPLHVPTAVDEVADTLVTAIALGEYVPGQRLPAERELARLLGVSRSTVSEALARLRAGGVVEVRRGRAGGSFVQDSWTGLSAAAVGRTLVPHRTELEQLSDLRCRWEEVVARTAAERRTARQARELRARLERFALARTSEEQHVSDIGLHAGVLAAARNPHMTRLSHELLAKVAVGMPVEPFERRFYGRALREHTALVQAVVDGDVELAGTTARRHFRISARTVQAVIERAAPAG
jgi:GntR family transcriptional repressor for pyruvate dehydrogenase complex